MKKTKPCDRNITISDIAESCGLSIMTVSRALRGDTAVKAATRELIMTAAEKLGYHRQSKSGRPSHTADALRPAVQVVAGTYGRNIALFYSELITAIERQLADRGCDCIIRTCDGSFEHFHGLKNILSRAVGIKGTLLVGWFKIEQLHGILDLVPEAILLDNSGDDAINIPYESISFDNIEAAKLAVRHLVEIGKKRILLLTGPEEHYFSREIYTGYRTVLKLAGLPVDNELIVRADFTMDGAVRAIETALASECNFDAVFTNDEMACGVYRALQKNNIHIPKQVAVCGCDGIPLARSLTPSLTTVLLNYPELSERAVEHLFTEHKPQYSPCRIRILPKLELRESTQLSD